MPLSQGWINEASPANAITSLGKSLASVRLVGEGTEEMDVPGPERRLAAVLAADMVGYSRLMEVDETGTLARLKTHRIELIDPAIAKNRGRIIKTTGDACWSNSTASPTRCCALPRFSAGWRDATRTFRRRGGCSFASASIWAT